MSMSESGKAVRELLAYLAGVSAPAVALRELEISAWLGGREAVANVRRLVQLGREAKVSAKAWEERADETERELLAAQASIRAMVGQPMPEDTRQVMDPPAGHGWVTGLADDDTPSARGRLVCATCTVDPDYGQGRAVLASECLERARIEAGS